MKNKRARLVSTAVRVVKSKLLVVILFISMGLLVSTHSSFESFNENWIDQQVRNNGWQGILYFVGFGVVFSLVGGPRQLVAFLGGYAFGFVNGTLLSTLAITFSCLLSFSLARYLGREFFNRKFSKKVQSVNRFLAVNPVSKTIIIRLLPIGNNLITNMVGGLTQVKARSFVLGSSIGYIPQMAIFALMGKGIVVQSFWKISISVILFLVSSIWSVYLYRNYRRQRALERLKQTNFIQD